MRTLEFSLEIFPQILLFFCLGCLVLTMRRSLELAKQA